jgi:threonine dehydrogenase-like Zn-dependent dehydrogenase
MNRTALIFEKPLSIRLAVESIADNEPGKLLVQTAMSAISAGTEMLLYKGMIPGGQTLDTGIAALAGSFDYPIKYGYTAVGRVVAVGDGIDPNWLHQPVFSFHPHESHFWAHPDELFALPPDIDPLEALFLSNMESAINFLMDGRPVIGETVAVFGQGIVGLLTTALLNLFPLSRLISVDQHALRRSKSIEMGAQTAFDPDDPHFSDRLPAGAAPRAPDGHFDLVFELSGNPRALNRAITCCGYGGRIVVGSWYGNRRADLDLGLHFHRNRIRLISSQVSTVAPELSARWSKSRRMQTVWRMLGRIRPAQLITHRFPIEQAPAAFELLRANPQDTLQVILTYGD